MYLITSGFCFIALVYYWFISRIVFEKNKVQGNN
jgi:hypothetical protein